MAKNRKRSTDTLGTLPGLWGVSRRDLATYLGALGSATVVAGCRPALRLGHVEDTSPDGLLGAVLNYATLRSLPTTALHPGAAVVVAGRAAASDGGAGVFRWVDAKADDDDALRLTPREGGGHWERIVFESTVHALWFPGADLGAKVNRAFAALRGPLSGKYYQFGKTIRLPGGSYEFSTPMNLDRARWLRLEGEGRMQTKLIYLPKDGGKVPAMSLVESRECELARFRVIERPGRRTATLIRITGTSLLVRDVWVGNAKRGIVFGQSAPRRGAIGHVDGLLAESCLENIVIEGRAGPLIFDGLESHAADQHNFHVTDDATSITLASPILQNGRNGVPGLTQSGMSKGLQLNGGVVRNNGGPGIVLESANPQAMAVVSGTYFEDNAAHAVVVKQNHTVLSNLSLADTRADGGQTQKGIVVTGARHCSIDGARSNNIVGALADVSTAGYGTTVNRVANVNLGGSAPAAGVFAPGVTVHDKDTGLLYLVADEQTVLPLVRTRSH